MGLQVVVGLVLVLASAFFVAAEYSLVSARRSRIEALAKHGNKQAKRLGKVLDDVSPYVAGTQIGITLLNIGIGSFTEPFISEMLSKTMGPVPPSVRTAISLLIVTFTLVVIGELCPKFLTLRHAEKVALATFQPVQFFAAIFKPLIWMAQSTARLILKPFGVDISLHESDAIPKEELMMLVQSGGNEGILDKTHAEMVTRALRLDVLAARDIMIHRLDIKWLDVTQSQAEVLKKLKQIPFSRLPVCRGDIDDVVGIAYLHDIVKTLNEPNFSLEAVTRPIVAIPENLTMEKIVQTMREEKIQMLIVMDEYGGTSGLVTLEDVVEEVFGELEDRIESERDVIEVFPNGRVSARADVRFDELVDRLHLTIDPEDNTDTLAQTLVDTLERVPRPGDSVDFVLGTMRVENMARRRITRVSMQIKPEFLPSATEVD